jgi:hypothetical protein
MKLLNLTTLVSLVLISFISEGHIKMTSPVGRMGARDDAKFTQFNPANPTVADNPGPCGTYTTPMSTRLQYVAGQTINVGLSETINHPGRFIVQFSPGGGQGFWNTANQLANVPDTQVRGTRSLTVKLPDTTCDTCMMRVLQQMDDQPGEFYVHCFDITLTAANAPPTQGSGNPQQVSAQESNSSVAEQPKFGGGCGTISSNDRQDPPNYLAMLLMMLPILVYFKLRRRSLPCPTL